MKVDSSNVDSLRGADSVAVGNAREIGGDPSVTETAKANGATGDDSIKSKNENSKRKTNANFSSRTTGTNEAKLSR